MWTERTLNRKRRHAGLGLRRTVEVRVSFEYSDRIFSGESDRLEEQRDSLQIQATRGRMIPMLTRHAIQVLQNVGHT